MRRYQKGYYINAEGHKKKAEEIEGSLQKLIPDTKGENVVAIVELACGIVQHLIAYGLETKYSEHIDTHVGLPKLLRNLNEEEIAKTFERLYVLRQGRWYGGRGNGEVVKECQQIIEKIKEWTK